MNYSLEKSTIFICQGTGCESSNSDVIRKKLSTAIEKYELQQDVEIKKTGCHGFCQKGPIVIIEPEKTFYTSVKEKDAERIIFDHFVEKKPVQHLLYKEPTTKEHIQNYTEIPFYKYQHRLILRNCGHIDPENIDDYLKVGGYTALKKVLAEYTPEKVIEEVTKSKLRGRGGAGFPTGVKWKLCHDQEEKTKYIICNADEGDPGAFMDRSTLEADPHSVIEGIIIGAYAIRASQGYIYVRAEYPLAVERVSIALREAKKRGFIGNNILGSNFSFNLEVFEGAGAFVCGEETALMKSIMGERGNPVSRPPYPAVSGLWGKPTNINNVKTWACVPLIINRGSDWFRSIGTEDSPGTAVFALTGKIANSGLIEVPFGITINEIFNNIGGGIPDGKKFKGVQTGGPSGGLLPASFLDTPIDYASMAKAGSILGSGGMIVIDEDDCVVNLAHYFLSFIQSETCGKCVPCRVGTKAMLDILEKIIEGKGEEKDLDTLDELSHFVKDASLCGLGQTAPNPVLTTIKYFRNEYEAHIKNKICPAKECKAMIEYKIDEDKCNGCTLCVRTCSSNAIFGKKGVAHSIDTAVCIKCGICFSTCALGAIVKEDSFTEEIII